MNVLLQIVLEQMTPSPSRTSNSIENLRCRAKMLSSIYCDNKPIRIRTDNVHHIINGLQLISLDKQTHKLTENLYRNLHNKNNFAIVIFGQDGFGKSSILTTAIKKIETEFIVLYLNGRLFKNELKEKFDLYALTELINQLSQHYPLINKKRNQTTTDFSYKFKYFKEMLQHVTNENNKVIIILDS
eukprot:248025_1